MSSETALTLITLLLFAEVFTYSTLAALTISASMKLTLGNTKSLYTSSVILTVSLILTAKHTSSNDRSALIVFRA